MNINYNANSAFPNQVVPLEEKLSLKYGSQVADAIQSEWFAQGRTNGNRYLTSFKGLSCPIFYFFSRLFGILYHMGFAYL